MLNLRSGFILLIISFFLTTSCSLHHPRVYTIGFSQCTGNDLWRKQMINEMKIEASFHDDIRLLIEDAEGNSDLQCKQIRKLMNKRVDLLIISPNESQPITAIAEEAYQSGIPTILIDRKINSDKYSAYIGADNYAIGKYAALFLGNLPRRKLKVLELWGLEGSSPAQERHHGFEDQLKWYPNLLLDKKVYGDWLKQEAYARLMEMPDLEKYNVVYGHNEEMAMGAYEAFINRKIDVRSRIFLGVDALQGKNGGIQAVIDRKLTATFLYPTGGARAIQLAKEMLDHQPFRRENLLNTALIDSTNVPILQLQSVQLNDYMTKIDAQLTKIRALDLKFNSQQTLLYISFILMGLALFLAILLFIGYYHSRRLLSELKLRNEKIEQQREKLSLQREQLVEMNQKIEDVTAQKLRFFTNVSHELKTPLSLLISPLERITEIGRNLEIKREIIVMKNNVERLNRLINQLLDFRKIEDRQMKLYVRFVNLINLLKNIKASYNYQAHIREIAYTMDIPGEEIILCCDQDKIEKVLINLLSNAFKFTPRGGKVHILAEEREQEVIIRVEDSGKGIPEDLIPKIFDRFYQGAGDYSSGTGIGLNLAREYIDLHKGTITVHSQEGLGSVFTITLRKGKNHLNEDYIVYDTEIVPGEKEADLQEWEDFEVRVIDRLSIREYGLLLVEDDDNMREYLENRLNEQYQIYAVANGREALKLLKNTGISLIICDVMMPEMDGFEFCKKVKENLAYSHIPVIMLTALTGEQQLIRGLTAGADDYIYKPFNTRHLELKIQNMLTLRQKMRESFKQEFLGSYTENQLDYADNKFIKKVSLILEKYITDQDISVERISTEIGMSRIHLYRKIKEVTGSSPSEFFRIFKVRKSLPLLKTGGLSISEVAYQCGFSSPAYYSKCFRELLNMSPSEYQEH